MFTERNRTVWKLLEYSVKKYTCTCKITKAFCNAARIPIHMRPPREIKTMFFYSLYCRTENRYCPYRKCTRSAKANFKVLSDCNWTRTQNHLVRERTLNYLAKLTKWLSCVLSTYLYGSFDCILSCHVRVSEWIHTL